MHTPKNLRELTFRDLVLGSTLIPIFAASNAHLGLEVGLILSSSIPAVVISMAVLSLSKNSNILENNMAQTEASVAGTFSTIIFVIPELFMCGYWSEFPLQQTFMICFCGGVLGVLFTIPLRRVMVVKSKLAYPEGRVAAEVLKVANKAQSDKKGKEGVKEIAFGPLIAIVMSLFSSGFKIIASENSLASIWNKMVFGSSMGYFLALLGAGYLVGLTGAAAPFVGMFLVWGVSTPYFSSFEFISTSEAASLAGNVWKGKARLIGTGAVAMAALWIPFELLKPVLGGMKDLIKHVKSSSEPSQQDPSMKSTMLLFPTTLLGLFATSYSFVSEANLSSFCALLFSVGGTILTVLIGFFVAVVCGYTAGLVDSSSSLISGIGLIATITSSLVILLAGADIFKDEALSEFAIVLTILITSVILVTAATSNDSSQDLKTGHLVGAAPWKQQVPLLVGCIFGSLAITSVLNLLYQAYGFVGVMPREGMNISTALAVPQVNLINAITQGIFHQDIGWKHIAFGIYVGIFVIIIDKLLKRSGKTLPPLAVGIGIYPPPSVNISLVIGSVLEYLVMKKLAKKYANSSHKDEKLAENEQGGTLFASGLIVEESICGVVIAGITAFSLSRGGSESPFELGFSIYSDELFALIFFIAVMLFFIKRTLRKD